MGGYGSGRWRSQRTKTTVEASLPITADAFKEALDHGPGCKAVMSWAGGSVSFLVEDNGGERYLRATYTRGKDEKARAVDYRVQVVKTAPHYGGTRWYFLCPLVVNGRPCLRRGDKLYLPPGGLYFGCRECYGLTYTSVQESHKFDRLFKDLAAEVGRGMTPAEVKRLMTAREAKE